MLEISACSLLTTSWTMGTYDWDVLYRDNNVDGKILMFNKIFTDCYDKHAPIRSIQPKHLPAPWFTQNIRSAMEATDRARTVWRRDRTEENHTRFKRNEGQALVRAVVAVEKITSS